MTLPEFMMISSGFGDYVAQFGYLGIFLFFVTVDQVTPIPEEVTLLTIGYLASRGMFNAFIAGTVSLVAFLAVDTAYFYLAKSGNRLVKKLKDRMKSKFMERYKHRFKHHMPKTLLVLNFIPRARMFGPILGGMLEVPFTRFL